MGEEGVYCRRVWDAGEDHFGLTIGVFMGGTKDRERNESRQFREESAWENRGIRR